MTATAVACSCRSLLPNWDIPRWHRGKRHFDVCIHRTALGLTACAFLAFFLYGFLSNSEEASEEAEEGQQVRTPVTPIQAPQGSGCGGGGGLPGPNYTNGALRVRSAQNHLRCGCGSIYPPPEGYSSKFLFMSRLGMPDGGSPPQR